MEGLHLCRLLGDWLHPPHFDWPWILDRGSLTLYVITWDGYVPHQPDADGNRPFTWGSTKYRVVAAAQEVARGELVSVVATTETNGVAYSSPSSGQIWRPMPLDTNGFWDYITLWGGSCMWEMNCPDVGVGFDMTYHGWYNLLFGGL
jgi:hypothetical protein